MGDEDQAPAHTPVPARRAPVVRSANTNPTAGSSSTRTGEPSSPRFKVLVDEDGTYFFTRKLGPNRNCFHIPCEYLRKSNINFADGDHVRVLSTNGTLFTVTVRRYGNTTFFTENWSKVLEDGELEVGEEIKVKLAQRVFVVYKV